MWEPRMRVGRKLKDTHAGALYTGHTPPRKGNHAVTRSHARSSSHTRSCRAAEISSMWHIVAPIPPYILVYDTVRDTVYQS